MLIITFSSKHFFRLFMFYKRNNQIITSKRNPKHPYFNYYYSCRLRMYVWMYISMHFVNLWKLLLYYFKGLHVLETSFTCFVNLL
ncbi:hypothetical protein HanRHA438_Chr12g0563381 [Helianthus annuus]|uniref:Uncharacterized protein n=1 Tax=Helianthus annuus TaxID=4232 RepID=A0A9K3HI54_HELAN|nr:hypothetical protein HanXRQr2_Chr12g0552031 [Helianthus annuus]KAJ0506086.1 hypothetical protein HanHA89_Chr12g0477951 [Helianthus annuus]KAJ0675756.1 hypothetical protein HanLR1_Chr12g0454841 [Helianthus annuus]KAJ0867454.1 hypothetical protein HanRHA438_Chr12g0563381 [Helianthus annuus]